MTVPRSSPSRVRPLLLSRQRAENLRIGALLRKESVGGVLLLLAAVGGLVWANAATGSYESFARHSFGPSDLHLRLTLEQWAADGLLAIFFFAVGLELKREFISGDLRNPRRAALPIAAALGGVLVPASIYLLINGLAAGGDLSGWAVPAATDIAFAVAVLAVCAPALPIELRTFLLTLAVVDDLAAVIIIASVYTSHLNFALLALAVLPLVAFSLVARHWARAWWGLLPLAILTWALVHASGVHATIAGVLLGFSVPVARSAGRFDVAKAFEHRIRPISAGIAVPIFAFLAAGVEIGGRSGLAATFTDPVAVGVIVALLVGKPLGVFGTTYLMTRFTRADLAPGVTWADLSVVSLLAGIGFTVSLLIADLAFGTSGEAITHVKVAVLAGSVAAASLASGVALVARRRRLKSAAQMMAPSRRLENSVNG